ncbi:GspE/PulE family protein [Cetobacterium somerae]|uniref:GspE/PulE family protein n=1 Tax=Cetobacterium sp. NK01 TaxID=2993530 RepID=UPI0021166400|nr:GspE/PulE family protein [Cetobacterium sp. NK01]MCQ8211928.1 GspE/PulE family protein [Cetobacterium sp. NK01]
MDGNIYFKREIFEIKDFNELKYNKEDILEFLNSLICYSLKERVSDIHIESKEKIVKIRVRIDGILKEYENLNNNFGLKLLTKLKLMSELDIGEKRLPQDGRFKGKYLNEKIDFRVSFIPTIFGERCVLRILKNNISKVSLENLGFSEENLSKLKDLVRRKNGLLIFCGPTGSGKTTTLYSIVNYLDDERLNIVTIEDPIEYQFSNINQIQCKNEIGLNFATVLRSVLRQDPDIILVGEIRDKETAEIALMASLTGHLVITTLHTKDSLSAIDRLINFGIDRFIIATAINAIESQRLIRKICPVCNGEKNNNCCNEGFKGREIVEEIIFFDKEIREIIINKNTSELENYLKKIGFKNILENGILKVNNKLTTKEEIIKECLI